MKYKVKVLYQAIAISSFFVLWSAIAECYHSPLFPTPIGTLHAFFTLLASRDGWYQIEVTTYRVFIGTLLGSCVGATCGILPRYSKMAECAVSSVVYPLLESVPSICWVLVFVVWFGIADITPILAIATAVIPFFIINIWEGVKELDENLIEMAMTYTRNRLRILQKIILPMLYPYVFSAFKTSFEVAWKVVILGEVFGAASGIGYMLWIANEVYAIEYVFAWTLCCAIIIIIFDYGVFNYIDRRYVRRWKR
jgi:NitT/TauT family transport system permease protein/sulfonate transport system permease protein